MSDNKIIENIVRILSKCPGLGIRSARRIMLYLLSDKDVRLRGLLRGLTDLRDKIHKCDICYNFSTCNVCNICADEMRDESMLIVVESVADLWAVERTGDFIGKYHVLGGVLSATNSSTPEDLGILKLVDRIRNNNILEVIIATNATIEGQTTAFLMMQYLKELNVKISKLANGIPMGGEIDFLDEGTLSTALRLRQPFE